MSDELRMGGGFNILPPVVKNLLILNVLFFMAEIAFNKFGIRLEELLGLHYFTASDFHFWQPFTYMFMHGDFGHLFFNMFALWMFGASVENYWGSKRFLIYYLITGLGAGLTHYIVLGMTMHPDIMLINNYLDAPSWENFQQIVANHQFYLHGDDPQMIALKQSAMQVASDPTNMQSLNHLTMLVADYKEYYLNAHNVIGASGAVFGVMLAFGMLFPNSRIYLYFLIPIKAKWLVIAYGLIELFYGVTGTPDGVAHFAHLGGMIFGILLILLWRRQNRQRNPYNDWEYSE